MTETIKVERNKDDSEKGFDVHAFRSEKNGITAFRFSEEDVISEEHLSETRKKNAEVFRLETKSDGVLYVIQLESGIYELNSDGFGPWLAIALEKSSEKSQIHLKALPPEMRTGVLGEEIGKQLTRWMTIRPDDWK